ncbi:hypothetical protein [Flagellimonas pacifica]|uniref:Uncharacterized protein n=1 Tax=Flagellimonas pacifica TaxID=1247520 RepID=A0A285M9M0_9FLAO|nr:hypothetical protein [Allomuricauda parva]SNY92211.1 hypothetical protein SAMN06265377_0026 [Allomuricauda parva]
MTYKIKSLIYLSCFVITATIYYGIEQEDEFKNQVNSPKVAETDFEDTDDLEDTQEDFVVDQE